MTSEKVEEIGEDFPTCIPGGGGVLGLEKGTHCSPTAAERWLSRREMAKKGGLSSYYIVR